MGLYLPSTFLLTTTLSSTMRNKKLPSKQSNSYARNVDWSVQERHPMMKRSSHSLENGLPSTSKGCYTSAQLRSISLLTASNRTYGTLRTTMAMKKTTTPRNYEKHSPFTSESELKISGRTRVPRRRSPRHRRLRTQSRRLTGRRSSALLLPMTERVLRSRRYHSRTTGRPSLFNPHGETRYPMEEMPPR